MSKAMLKEAFRIAKEENYPYVFVVIDAEKTKECIVVPSESFDAKEKFYMNAYSDELVHVMNSEVKIVEYGCGNKEHLSNFI